MYGLITCLRNLLYDRSILTSYHPDIPVIVIGNMIAGGTGKTPMVAWIARELSQKYRVAILSRGYGRLSRGFKYLDGDSTPDSVGDEPMEMRLLLPDIPIAVDASRTRGIQNLTSGSYGKIDIILMDDGFQHRRVTPGFSIILDDFNRPLRKEKLLPAGLRREPLSGLKRAGLVVVTKKQFNPDPSWNSSRIILITGIADPQPLADDISKTGNLLNHLKFHDHHRYTLSDAELIRKTFDAAGKDQNHEPPLLLTTGKDYVKLCRLTELSDLPLQWIPVGPPVHPDQKPEILNKIYQYVESVIRIG